MVKTKLIKLVSNQKKKTIFQEVKRLLNYLQEKDFDSELRQKYILQKKFFFLERISKLCLQDKYIKEDKQKLKFYKIDKNKKIKGFLEDRFRITVKGLNFLENIKKEEKNENHNKVVLFLAIVVGLTTIASFLYEILDINPVLFSFIYLVFIIGTTRYFKRGKTIRI